MLRASLFGVVDARGTEMNQGETVTFFNDVCVLAPGTLVHANEGKTYKSYRWSRGSSK